MRNSPLLRFHVEVDAEIEEQLARAEQSRARQAEARLRIDRATAETLLAQLEAGEASRLHAELASRVLERNPSARRGRFDVAEAQITSEEPRLEPVRML